MYGLTMIPQARGLMATCAKRSRLHRFDQVFFCCLEPQYNVPDWAISINNSTAHNLRIALDFVKPSRSVKQAELERIQNPDLSESDEGN